MQDGCEMVVVGVFFFNEGSLVRHCKWWFSKVVGSLSLDGSKVCLDKTLSNGI